jgi:outer membrane murein-binding lipoprotein Lpp
LSYKEICTMLGTELHNEFVQIRADQMEMGQQLTERINGVANQVKALDGKVTQLDTRLTAVETKVDRLDTRLTTVEMKVDRLDTKVDALAGSQTDMMQILIAIQRKLDVN